MRNADYFSDYFQRRFIINSVSHLLSHGVKFDIEKVAIIFVDNSHQIDSFARWHVYL